MQTPRVLTIILAGGEGNRLEKLTENRAKTVVPFLGSFRLMDFVLSNVAHSQLRDVWVLEQFQTHSINEHLQGGRPWDLDRTWGGLQILPPFQGNPESDWHQGNADALWRNARLIREHDPDIVLVLSSDAIYRLDYREVIEAHQKARAEVTMVVKRLPASEATRFGVVEANNGRVTHFDYKPEQPRERDGQSLVTCEVFVYDARVLLGVLDALAQATGKSKEDAALSDFGHELLPELVKRRKAHAFEIESYWRDVGTIESYFGAQQEFLGAPPFDVDDPAWPIWTRMSPFGPARLEADASVEQSLVCSGARVAGRVNSSIIGPGAVVEVGASVEECVLNSGVTVKAGVRLRRAIVDEGAVVARDVEGGEEVVVV